MRTRPLRPASVLVLAALALAACTGNDDASPSPHGPSGTASAQGTPAPGAAEKSHVNNPFAGASLYVNPAWQERVLATADDYAGKDKDLADAMREVADQPTAVWLDRIAAIEGTDDAPGLREHLDAALAQREGDAPMVVTLVIYDLPGRDCYALASNGELPATDDGLATYKADYIDAIADILAEPRYNGLRIAAVIEPDSLPNLVTNANEPACQKAAPYYKDGVAYALDALHALPQVYTYLDAAHSGWLGWDNNAAGTVNVFADVAHLTEDGFNSVDGFVTNTANTTPLEEPFLKDPNASADDGQQLKSAKFYEFNPLFDEADWTADLHRRLVNAGFPASIGMVIDTSRNGWGGPDRPTNAGSASGLDAYVNESRVDRRVHRGAWCNPDGAGLGRLPQALPDGYPDSHLDAFLWVKPPGESDGASQEVKNDEGKGFDRMCDPTFSTDRLGGNTTHALPDAPLSGKWFAAQFAQLVANAYPAVGEPVPAPRKDADATKPASASGGSSASGGKDGDDGGNGGQASGAQPWKDADLDPDLPCSAYWVTTNAWDGGFQADVTVVGHQAIDGWTVSLTLPDGVTIDQLWNGDASGKSGAISVGDVGWNGPLTRASTGAFGFTAKGEAPDGDVAISCKES